jgi:hypothetical protein
VTRGRLVVHAHFYQPLRADPFTGELPPDPSAAPYRDWNARITAECYRPNAERGALRRASWDLGPTLASYLADSAPDVLAGYVAADEAGRRRLPDGPLAGPGIAQAFHHSILPLAPVHDRRTEIRWGLREFELRFGRPATALWLPETAVDLATLRILAEAGVQATILAPWQADGGPVDVRRPYRVDLGNGRHLAVVFYDGDLSGAVSFEPAATDDADRFARERVAPRLAAPLADGTPATVVIATDGELYGHHQHFRDLFLQRLVTPDLANPDRGFDVVDLATAVAEPEGRTHPEVRVRDRTSWSCHHGVLRWSAECPDVPDGRWKAPLRGALDRLAGGIDAVTEAVGRELRVDPWAVRDRYVDAVVGETTAEALAADALGRRGGGDARRRLLDLLEGQRWRLAMFASDGWYWDDPARVETHQVLRSAARAARLIDGLAGTALEERLVEDLAVLRSPAHGTDGATIYRQALAEVGQPPPHDLGERTLDVRADRAYRARRASSGRARSLEEPATEPSSAPAPLLDPS